MIHFYQYSSRNIAKLLVQIFSTLSFSLSINRKAARPSHTLKGATRSTGSSTYHDRLKRVRALFTATLRYNRGVTRLG